MTSDPPPGTIGVIGLGSMGLPMALTLGRAGLPVLATDLSPERRELAAAELETTGTAAELLARAGTVLLSVPGSPQVERLLLGEGGFLAQAPAGSLVIDTTTGDPQTTRRLAARLAEQGHDAIDAPVSGGAAAAASGSLSMMVGGTAAAHARATPVLDALSGGKHARVGNSGAGHLAKLLNNLLCAAHLLTASEAVRVASAGGIDAETFVTAINGGSGRSATTEVNFPRWILPASFDSGFAAGLMRRDVGLAAEVAERLGVPLDVLATTVRAWQASAASLADGDDFNRIVEIAQTVDLVEERR